MIGQEGIARVALEPGVQGLVDTHGELWRAVSARPVDAKQRVRILEVRGLTLVVEPIDAARHGDNAWTS